MPYSPAVVVRIDVVVNTVVTVIIYIYIYKISIMYVFQNQWAAEPDS